MKRKAAMSTPVQVDPLEALKRRFLAAIASANASHGADNEVPGLKESIEALPDRQRLARLPAEVRRFVEEQLATIDGESA